MPHSPTGQTESSVISLDETVLYRNDRTLVLRRRLPDGRCVINKLASGLAAQERLRNEAAILDHLSAVPGVARLAQSPSAPDSLSFEDENGISLAQVLKERRLDIPAVLSLAIDLAQVLAGVHGAAVIHKDINPSNILLVGPGSKPVLIDFNIATRFAEERPTFAHQSHIVGTLAYMSPEQTGRTGRPVDQRSDLYAFGVTLYELAVGHKPFETEDLLGLINDHLVTLPTPPVQIGAGVPPMLSAIVMKLLQKEADRRYQSAEGLAHDLKRLRTSLAQGESQNFVLGEFDFPSRLTPPSRLVGREAEIRVLEGALDQALRGECRAVFLAGVPGVGKSALINEMQPAITGRNGWFVCGKFDQYREEGPTAVVQALRALGRLILAEPQAQLEQTCLNIRSALGANLGFGPSQLPEFSMLLSPMPKVTIDDPRQAEARMMQATMDLLRAIASPERPVVMMVDDLQWAPEVALHFMDVLLTTEHPIKGLLVVGAYRANDVDAEHGLRARLSRWETLGVKPPIMAVQNLPPTDISLLIGEMLRLDRKRADELGQAISARTDGNPYDTVELMNALRHDGLLAAHNGSWQWDPAAIQRYVGNCDVVGLLNKRIEGLPATSIALLETIATLGGEAALSMLATATLLDTQTLLARLAPALEDGLLRVDNAEDRLFCFRHDRVQQAMFERMPAAQQGQARLSLARRLSALPQYAAMAAQQYLLAAADITDAQERSLAVALFKRAAARHRVERFVLAERFLAAAIGLIEGAPADFEPGQLIALRIERHAALYALARLHEADTLYCAIVDGCADPMVFVQAAAVQIASLQVRARQAEAMALGLALLSRLGVNMPADLQQASALRLAEVTRWVAGTDKEGDHLRAEVQDPHILAQARLLMKTATAAFFADTTIYAWLTCESHKLWVAHGPCADLLSGLRALPMLLAGALQDHRSAYAAARHLLGVGEACGYGAATELARFTLSLCAMHWMEPLEHSVAEAHKAAEGLMRAGDLLYSSFVLNVPVPMTVDCSPTLAGCEAELRGAQAFAARTGNAFSTTNLLPLQQLLRALRGQTDAAGSFCDDGFDEAAYEAKVADPPSMLSGMFHIARGLSAAFFGDAPKLIRHAAAALPALPRMPGLYQTSTAHFLQALALAERVRKTPGAERGPILAELDGCRDWLARRAADAPVNYLHLVHLVDAERAWAIDDATAAAIAFEAAMAQAETRTRPWHQAFIAERTGLFHLARGFESTARLRLMQAYQLYDAWGAAGKVREMARLHPFLRGHANKPRRTEQGSQSDIVSSDAVDLLAIVRASQTMSSETTLARLNASIVKLLGAMTGATSVLLIVRRDGSNDWLLASSLGPDTEPVSVEQAAEQGLLPMSAFRYAKRTGENLLVPDAKRDTRFSGDAYMAGVEHCSLLVTPITSQGELRAVLMLENRLCRGAFSSDRLETLTLIAGQLSVSIDNAMLYASLERKVAERTAALEEANRLLETLSVTDALTGLPNRRRFNDALEAEWLRAKRSGTPIGLAMMDVDNFKLYNDQYGHQRGDACLKLVADAMKTGLRAGSDLIARYGGEEFVLLLPNANTADTLIVAERVRAAVAARQEPHAKSGHGIVTISLGVVSFVPTQDSRPQQFIELADEALYEAKRTGRNKLAASAWVQVPQA
ncbi:MAG: diguanylate cyclase [Cytophagales bacterium]|nr:diguanylate cyclase [Rhizobacter sp.]